MCSGAVVGGMERLERRYVEEGRKTGIEVKVFNTADRKIAERMRYVDAVVVFTDRVSHEARKLADRTARANRIPVLRWPLLWAVRPAPVPPAPAGDPATR